jgi:hypothetical protein
MDVEKFERTKLARTAGEYLNLVSSDADWIARTEEDVRTLRGSLEPLRRLPDADFEEFLAGLGYAAGGVACGSYKILMSTCTISEIFDIFERFGMDRSYALHTLEAACVQTPDMGHAECQFSFWSFCSSLCGKEVVVFPPFQKETTNG